VTPFSKFRS